MAIFDTPWSAWQVARRYVVGCCVFGVAVTMPGRGVFGQDAAPNPVEEEARWAVVQEYLDERDEWSERTGIPVGFSPVGLRLDTEAEPAPDATAAVDAARKIVAAGGARTVEAAVFLIETVARPPHGRGCGDSTHAGAVRDRYELRRAGARFP